MARDSEASGDSGNGETNDYGPRARGSRLDRRSYLKMAGAALASVGSVAASSHLSDAAEYETITVPAGTTRTITVGDGETFENKLIDMTADGASAKILTSGSGWTIRNVGFKGTHPGGNYLMIPGVADADGHGLVENVYMGDGQPDGSLKGAIWVNANMPHRGTITFRNFHMAHLINGLYASGPGTQGAGGNIRVEDSYFYSNSVANIRTNGKKRSNVVKNTVVHIDGTQPELGPDTTAPGSTVSRAIWSWYGECHLENCDVVGNLATSEGGYVTDTNTRFGSEADTTPPEGVPMTAEEAASGSSTSSDGGSDGTTDSSTDLPNTLSISGGSASNPAEYSFSVTEAIEKSTDRSASIDSEDTITDGSVEGLVAGGTDSYRFSGSVSGFSIDGDATVYLNDEVVDPATLSDGTSSSLSKYVVIDGSGTKGLSTYTFSVDGEVEKDAERGSINSYDSISDGTVTGRVINGVDAYRYSGSVTEFHLEGTADVRFEDA